MIEHAPPGADVMGYASHVFAAMNIAPDHADVHALAHALQQYGDERAAAAAAQANRVYELHNRLVGHVANLAGQFQQAMVDAAAAAIEEAARVADKYADNPVSGEQNNTLKAFEQGMDHQAGAVDSAVAIAAAIRSLKP